ncbi:hypothetical protein GRF59_14775 [Paenibacillus sp. HJL G12]|uniref:Uncharacterized protein n=1 Tax=Paenibacillus dendrobii TaxID=2691084 RepID=A0A7X3IJ18_9BACL|nr:hypothetical protein [Paenibacillus dendrobii]MWV44883.1 hypothetical protein [Paenibacillus dendrobii]
MKSNDYEEIVEIFIREHFTRNDAEQLAKSVLAFVNAAELDDGQMSSCSCSREG